MSDRSALRALAITSLFPNRVAPNSATFNRQQLSHLARHCALDVWATVPWYPGARQLAPRSPTAKFTDVPTIDQISGIDITHPRTLHIPIVGRVIAGPLYAVSLLRRFNRVRHRYDVILGTWAYPDGWASVVLGKAGRIPVVVKVHGSDINVVARKKLQRLQLETILPQAAAVVAVSQPLADEVANLGISRERIHVIRNGVDGERFSPGNRESARATLATWHPDVAHIIESARPMVLYVGNLKRTKGVFDLLEAWPQVTRQIDQAILCIVGSGPAADEVVRRCAEIKTAYAMGPVDHTQVPVWLRSSTALCLPSWNEGTPNVVLEALSCDRPVVATQVGGIPDLLDDPILGSLVCPRDPHRLATHLIDVLSNPRSANEVLSAAKIIDWDESARALHRVLADAAHR